MRTFPLRSVSLFLAALVAPAFLGGCSQGDATGTLPTPAPIAVEIVTVTSGEIEDIVDLVGQLEAEESVMLKAETSGVIRSVEVEEGSEVAKGELLFRMRDDEQVARLREAEARLALADEEYTRGRSLHAKGTLSQAEFDRATAERDAARARRDLAQVELQRMEIRAPFEGVLGSRQVSPGDRVRTDTGLVQIDAIDRLRLLFTLPEIAVPLARTGAPLELGVAPFPGERFSGEVYFIAPSLDPANRRLLLKAWVPNPDHRLRPGMFATIGVEVARKADALTVPEAAISFDTNGPYVWRVGADDTAERQRIGLGIRRGGRVEVTSGLGAGDRVVAAGTHKVAAGARLRAVPAVGRVDSAG